MVATKIEKPKYPSVCGSHESMVMPKGEAAKIVEQLAGKKNLSASDRKMRDMGTDDKMCICVDDSGPYLTERSRLDTGLADPNRYAESRIGNLFTGEKKD